VKISYFPNWEVSGADGPYRIAPNLMVVVPTSTHVHLTYGRSALDISSYVLTFIGLGLLVVWRRRGDFVYPAGAPAGLLAGGDRRWTDRFDDDNDDNRGGIDDIGDDVIDRPPPDPPAADRRDLWGPAAVPDERTLDGDVDGDGDGDLDADVDGDASNHPGTQQTGDVAGNDTPAMGVTAPEEGPEWPPSPDSV